MNNEPKIQTAKGKCPVCGSKSIRKDFDYPKTMRCCMDCGADFMKDGEIILDPRLIK